MKEYIVHGSIPSKGVVKVRVFARDAHDATKEAKSQFGMTSFIGVKEAK